MPIREAQDTKEFAEVIMLQDHVYRPLGFGTIDHNVYCPVCHNKAAVWNLGGPKHGILDPCWDCQKKGYITLKLGGFAKWVLNLLNYQLHY